jgi:Domain of unknown function (DUF4062)
LGTRFGPLSFRTSPVDHSLYPVDSSLRNVERADQYVLIVNDRYGSTYEGTAYPRHPLPEEPKRTVSITWYEYLRALECGKPVRFFLLPFALLKLYSFECKAKPCRIFLGGAGDPHGVR